MFTWYLWSIHPELYWRIHLFYSRL